MDLLRVGPCGLVLQLQQASKAGSVPQLRRAFSNSRTTTRLAAKRSSTQQKQASQQKKEVDEDIIPSAALLSGYEPVDDEGNPWWEPPESDFWEGGAWNWLGRSASFVLPTVVAFSIAAGVFAMATYVGGGARQPPPSDQTAQQSSSESSLDLLLGDDEE